HGMPLAMAMGLDNRKKARNEVVNITLDYWEKCKNLFDIKPKMNPEDLVFIGLRSSEVEEDALIEEFDVKKILVNKVREIGTEQTVKESLIHLKGCDSIYISLDVDSMDPELTSYGTGTPVKDGLTPTEVIELVSNLLKDDRIKALEICEINPLLDNKNRMAEISLVILEDIINLINKE
ncbi:MAG: arginase family protein, partial [Candidatus Kapaibacterium sp.]